MIYLVGNAISRTAWDKGASRLAWRSSSFSWPAFCWFWPLPWILSTVPGNCHETGHKVGFARRLFLFLFCAIPLTIFLSIANLICFSQPIHHHSTQSLQSTKMSPIADVQHQQPHAQREEMTMTDQSTAASQQNNGIVTEQPVRISLFSMSSFRLMLIMDNSSCRAKQ